MAGLQSASHLLNLIIGGQLAPSLQHSFTRLTGMVDRLDDRVRRLASNLTRMTANTLSSDKFLNNMEKFGKGMTVASGAVALSAKAGASMENQLIQALITDGKGISSLDSTRLAIHGMANKGTTGQTMENLTEGLGVYVSSGMAMEEALQRLRFSGKVTTATGSSVPEIVQTELAMKSMFNIVGKTSEETAQKTARAWGILATAGNQGSFELKNMAQHMTSVGASAQKLGLTGERDLAFMAAGLQAQIKESPDPSSAANNFFNIMEKLSGDATLADKLKGKGVNVAALKKKGFANSQKGLEGNTIELIVDAIGKRYDQLDESKRGAFLGELIQDAQARTGLQALLKHRKFIADTKRDAIAGGDSGIIDKQYATAMEASAKSWESISNSLEKISQAATIAFAPTLKWTSGILENVTKAVLEFTTGHQKLAGWLYPVGTVVGGFAALGVKLRFLGTVFNAVGFTKIGGMLARFPRLTSLIGMGFRGMLNFPSMMIARLANLRFMLGGTHAILRVAFSRWWTGIAARSGFMFTAGLRTVMTRSIGALFGTLGLVILAAIGGWQLGKWIDSKLDISGRISEWWAEISGLNARMEALKNPVTSNDMDASRLSALSGDAGQKAREGAIAKWEARKKANEAKLAAKKGEWWTSDADKLEMDNLSADSRLADAQIRNLREQMARQAGGQNAITDVAAAQRQLAMYESIIKRGGSEDVSLADAQAYASGLRAQLAQAKANGVTLAGQASSSSHTTTLQVNVSGATADGAGQSVASAVEAKLKERDREVARSYRGVASTGWLGE